MRTPGAGAAVKPSLTLAALYKSHCMTPKTNDSLLHMTLIVYTDHSVRRQRQYYAMHNMHDVAWI